MTGRYRVVVTFTAEVVDEQALVDAGREHWAGLSDGWAVEARDGDVVEAASSEVADVVPSPEASLAWLVGERAYPTVPGVRFTGMSVNAEPAD